MRIAHVVDSLEVGGAETIVVQLCRAQRDAGHQPSVCCLLALGPLADQLASEAVPVDLLGPAGAAMLSTRLFRHFRRVRPHAVHCHNAAATIAAALPAKLSGARVISTRHGLVPPPFDRRREIKYWLAARACRNVVAVCEAAHRNLESAPLAQPRKIVTVYNGVAPVSDAVSYPVSQGAARDVRSMTTPSAETQPFILVTVGRLNPIKAQPVLLEATAIARRQAPALQLWIVGDGPQRASLEALVRRLQIDHLVKFWGEQPSVARFLRNANLFVLSSDSEGLPISLLEAMSAGRACLTTDVGGMTEVVGSSGAGELVPPRNPQALADAITRLARSPDQLRIYEQAARRAYEQRFTLTRMAADYERLYPGR